MFNKVIFFFLSLGLSVSAYANTDIQHWQSDNGAQVYYVQAPELPMVDISLVFNAGAARDGEKSGLALMTASMLDEGAGDLSADQIAEAFADTGAQFSASSERDMAVVSLRSLTDEQLLQPALKTFTTILSQPRFPQNAFERVQRQILLGLRAEKESPNAVAARTFYQYLYPHHAYGTMPSGEMATVEKLTRTDLQRFYERYYVSRNAVITIVGDVDKAQAEHLANQLSAVLKVGKPAADIQPVPALTQAQTIKVKHPSSQTTILMGQPGVSRDDADYFPLYVGNHILGGSGLVSMLSDELREKRGLTYGVYSYFRPMLQAGPYIFSVQTRNDKAQESLQVMRDTLKQFIANGPTEAQLEEAKQNITGGFALQVDSNSKIAGYLGMIGFYHLPLDYLDSFNDKINAVTIDQIKAAYQRRIDADKLLTVMVGGTEEQEK